MYKYYLRNFDSIAKKGAKNAEKGNFFCLLCGERRRLLSKLRGTVLIEIGQTYWEK